MKIMQSKSLDHKPEENPKSYLADVFEYDLIAITMIYLFVEKNNSNYYTFVVENK